MKTKVKICGVTRIEDALAAVELGAFAIGFNFYQQSTRYVAPEKAAEIISKLPDSVICVGVFANEDDPQKVAEVARQAGVASVQLHGLKIPPADSLPGFNIICAFQVGPDFDLSELSRYNASTYLLDGFSKDKLGGTGRTFDWTLAGEAVRYGRGSIIVAGGLTPENVAAAVRAARPYAVDVAGGVESGPGRKDVKKMEAFFAAVREADQE